MDFEGAPGLTHYINSRHFLMFSNEFSKQQFSRTYQKRLLLYLSAYAYSVTAGSVSTDYSSLKVESCI